MGDIFRRYAGDIYLHADDEPKLLTEDEFELAEQAQPLLPPDEDDPE